MRPIIGITSYVVPATWGVRHDAGVHPEVIRDQRLFGALVETAG